MKEENQITPDVDLKQGRIYNTWRSYDSTTFFMTIWANVLDFDNPVNVNPEKIKSQFLAEFKLNQNYPNPFNPATTINYNLAQNSFVTLRIYNTLGQEVKTLVNAYQSKGFKSVSWDGKDNAGIQLSSGVYIFRIEAGDFAGSRKMVLMR